MASAMRMRTKNACLPRGSKGTSELARPAKKGVAAMNRKAAGGMAADRRRNRTVVYCNAEDNKEDDAVEASTEAEETVEVEEETSPPSAMDRIKAVLEGEASDESLASIKAAFSELETDVEELKTSAADAEGRAIAAEKEVSSLKDQYLRLNADFENYRRRTASEKGLISSKAQGEVVDMLLPIVDNFELAKKQIQTNTEEEEKIDRSYQGIYKQFVEVMKNLGVVPVDTVGAPFDPEFHEAIMREENNEVEDGTVIEEYRKGFTLKEKLLRPAMVKVSVSTNGSSDSRDEHVTEEA